MLDEAAMSQGGAPARVLIATPVLLLGGTEIHILDLVRTLVAGGHETAVCCYCEHDGPIVEAIQRAGAAVQLLGIERPAGRLNWSGAARLVRGLRAVLREFRPGVVHVQYLAPGLIPIVVARLSGQRTVFATVHIAGAEFYGRKARFLLRRAAALCTAFFCVSRAVESFWFGSSAELDQGEVGPHRRHFTVYNAVPCEQIERVVRSADRSALRAELGVGAAPVIGFVGRLARQKGLPCLIEAFAAVAQAVPATRLVVVGDGPERAVIESDIRARGLTERATLLGALPRAQVFQYLSVFDVLAAPSLFEGFGLMAAEAGAAGVPVVASSVAGLSEVVRDGETGLLVAPADAPALAEALVRLLKDRALRIAMGGAAQQAVRARFAYERFQAATLAAYRRFAPPRDSGVRA